MSAEVPSPVKMLLNRIQRDVDSRADVWLAVTCHNEDGEMVSFAIPFQTELEATNYLDAEAKRVTGFGADRINLKGRYDFTGEPGLFFGEVLPLNLDGLKGT
jgi:hypothetical protein